MKILDELTSALDLNAPVKDICQGVFYTGVVTRTCGLAATLPRDAMRQDPPLVKEPGFLNEKDTAQLVRLAYSERILEAAIGMATINSLLDVDEDACVELNARDLILEKGRKKQVVIVGHFPFTDSVRTAAEALWVIEKNPKKGDVTEKETNRLIPNADVVAITGTAFTNHTLRSKSTRSIPISIANPIAIWIVPG